MKVLNIAKQMIEFLDHPALFVPSPCCPKLTAKEGWTWWPRPKQSNGLIPEETLDLALKWFQTRFKLQGFNFKVSKKSNKLTLLQLIFTHGVKGPILKTKNEIKENIQTILLTGG